MKVEIQYQPSGTIAICELDSQDCLVAEGGSLMALQGPVQIETTTRQKGGGGLLKGIKRLISGESFFLNKYTVAQSGKVWLGTPLPGDILVKKLNGEKLIIQGGSYLASEQDIHIDLEWQGLKSAFSGEGMFWIKAKGSGAVLMNSFGFIYPIQVQGDYIVDTSHIVAFEETLNFSISKASSSWWGALLGGEGFVCRFKGQGTVWLQSHNPNSFGQELTPFLTPRKE